MTQNKSLAANSKPEKHPARKAPKKITETYLHNAGLYYLERFASSSGNFRAVMARKIHKSCACHADQNPQECLMMLEQLITKFERAGLLNDETYTRAQIVSLRRRGQSERAIMTRLKLKELDETLIQSELARHAGEQQRSPIEAEYASALVFARKKRIGPFRTAAKKEKDFDPKKDLARMARAGFSYDTSRRVLEISSDTLEEF